MLMLTMLVTRTLTGAGEEVSESLADKVAGFFDYMIGRVPSWIAGLIVFVLAIFIAKMAKSAVEARISDQVDEEHQEVLVLAGRVTYFGSLIFGITVALKIAGIDLTTILAAVAFGIGFALRDLIMNFLSGVLILMSRHVIIGDFIKVGNTIGKVVEIQTRATILKAIDGTKVIVPNSEIFTKQVVSYTTNPFRRVVIPLYIAYDADINYAIKVAIATLKKHPKILKKPSPSVIVKDYGDSTIDLAARFWVGSRDGWFKIRSEMMAKLWTAFEDAGIVVPYEVMHLETNKDTEGEWKEAGERAKRGTVEMGLSQAIHENGQAPAATPPPPAANPPVAAAVSNVSPEQPALPPLPSVPLPAQPVAAPETVAVIPEAEYQDQMEIDGQA